MKGHLEISFGMIFSIILIVVFLGFAFLAIQKFLEFQDQVKEKKFYDSFKGDIEKVWKSTMASKEVEYIVPSKTEKACFTDDPYENVYLYYERPSDGTYLEHLDITNSFCIDAMDGKVKFSLEKNYGDSLVKVSGV